MKNPYDGTIDAEENKRLYDLQQQQRAMERKIRKQKREVMAWKTSVDNLPEGSAQREEAKATYQKKAAKLQELNKQYNAFCEEHGLKPLRDRLQVARWDKSQATAAAGTVKSAKAVANRAIIGGTPEEKLKVYLDEKQVVDTLDKHGVKFKQRISEKEIIVDAGRPKIPQETKHAAENRMQKTDRTEMDTEHAQKFVDEAKLVLYSHDRETIKFLAENGYAVLNFKHELVTAVPQKWRKKYDKYIEGEIKSEKPE